MPNDPTPGTTAATQDGGSAPAATGTPAKPAADGSAAQETAEQKAERLAGELAEATRKNAQLLSEKNNTEEVRRKAEQALADAEQRARAAQQPPNNAATSGLDLNNPWAQEMLRLQQAAQSDPVNFAFYDAQYRAAQINYQRDMQNAQRQVLWAQSEAELAKVPADARDRVRAKWMTGDFRTVEAAHAAVRGEDAEKIREQLKERDEALKDAEARLKAKPSAGTAPVIGSPSNGDGPMKIDDYEREVERLTKAGKSAEALKLVREVESGKRPLVG